MLVRFFFFGSEKVQSPLSYLRTLCPHKKMRKAMRNRKDMRGTNYTYCISCFFDIASN